MKTVDLTYDAEARIILAHINIEAIKNQSQISTLNKALVPLLEKLP